MVRVTDPRYRSSMTAERAARVPPRIRRAITEFRRLVEERFGARVHDVRLFGSYARGDWGPDSDADVLVVVDGLVRAEQTEIFGIAADLFLVHLVRISPFAVSREDYEHMVRGRLLITREIERDGVAP